MTRTGWYNLWREYHGRSGRPSTNINVVLIPRGEVTGNSRVEMGVSRPREGRCTVRVSLAGLLEGAAGAAGETTTRKTFDRTREAKVIGKVAGGGVVMISQREVQ